MNRLHMPQKTGLVLLVIGLFAVVVAIATLGQTFHALALDTSGVTAVATSAHDEWHTVRSHCLIYGKYCLSDAFRGR